MKKILVFFLLCIISFLPCFAEEEQVHYKAQIKFERFLNGAPEIIIATAHGNLMRVRELLKNGVDPNETYSKIPVSFFAVYFGEADILKELLIYGANPNVSYMRESILGFSIARKQQGCVGALIKKGADVNHSAFGETDLNYAIKLKQFEIAKMLLKAGATPDRKTVKLVKKTTDIELRDLVLNTYE